MCAIDFLIDRIGPTATHTHTHTQTNISCEYYTRRTSESTVQIDTVRIHHRYAAAAAAVGCEAIKTATVTRFRSEITKRERESLSLFACVSGIVNVR